jgi:hypothetical protein
MFKKWVYHASKYGCNFLQIRNVLIAYSIHEVERKIRFEKLFMEEFFSPSRCYIFVFISQYYLKLARFSSIAQHMFYRPVTKYIRQLNILPSPGLSQGTH